MGSLFARNVVTVSNEWRHQRTMCWCIIYHLLLFITSRYSYQYYDYYADYQYDQYDSISDLHYKETKEILTVLPDSSFTVSCLSPETGLGQDQTKDQSLYHDDELYRGGDTRYNVTSHTYFIHPVKSGHAGQWRCGQMSPVHIIVMPSMDQTAVIINDQLVLDTDISATVTVTEDQVLAPVCVSAGQAGHHVTSDTSPHWIFGDTRVNQSREVIVRLDKEGREHATYPMDMFHVSRTHQGHVLECSLYGRTVDVSLHVEYPPQFTISRIPHFGTPVITETSVSLHCDVDSNPRSGAYWEHDGVIVSNTSDLVISSVSLIDEGWYQCNANHKFGNFSSVGYFLAVKPADIINSSVTDIRPCSSDSEEEGVLHPTVFTPLHNISTSRGNNVTIYTKYCSMSPVLAVVWVGPQVLVKQGEVEGRFRTSTVGEDRGDQQCTTVSLSVERVDSLDSGLYIILVSTEEGVVQGKVWLDVAQGGERLGAEQISGAWRSYCDILVILSLILTLIVTS